MQVGVNCGHERWEFEIAAEKLLAAPAVIAPALADPATAVRNALEHPFAYPALRRA